MLFSCLRLEQQSQQHAVEIYPQTNAFQECSKSLKKFQLHRLFRKLSSGIIPIFHKRKHRSPLVEEKPESDSGFTLTEQLLVEQLAERGHSEFTENILFYISGFIVTKFMALIACTACKSYLISSPLPLSIDHDYCGVKTTQHSDTSAASAFTLFINRGG